MKKVILLATTLLIPIFSLLAQTDQGTFAVGGQVSFGFQNSSSEVDDNTTADVDINSVNISPSVGFFVIDQFVAGLSLNASRSNSDNGGFETTSTAFSAGPFMKYYLEEGPFFQASMNIGKNRLKNDGFDIDSDIFGWTIGVGYAVFLNEWISLEPGVTYGRTVFKQNDVSIDTRTINKALVFSAGFNIFLH